MLIMLDKGEELVAKRSTVASSVVDYILRHHPWVRHDIVQGVLDDPATDEADKVKILALRGIQQVRPQCDSD